MTTAAIYARVSSARQREEQTIKSQTSALIDDAGRWELDVPADWVFEDEGYSGATLVRPGLERLRDLAAQVPVDVVLCYSPDRLARRYAYQALLIDEFARAGTEVRFVKSPRAETPEDQLLVQFQGMIAEYERALRSDRLCCPARHRYYDSLRLPLGWLSLPALHGYRQPSFPGLGPGAEEDLSSSIANLLTIPRPLTPGSSSASAPGPRTPSMAFAV